jgi:MFS family permease
VSLVAPLRQRDFRLLWTGMSVSLLGDGFFLVAVAWETFALSNQPASLAYVGVALSLPQVAMLLVGGAVSDRWGCRQVLIWADWARAAAVGILAILVTSGGLHLWELYLAAGTLGVAAAFASPAFDALVPQLVPNGQLHQANAIEQFVRPATIQLAGPALGGLAVATIGSVGALAFDASSFVFSALCMVRMTSLGPTPVMTAASDRGGIGQDVRQGLRYVRGRVWLWGTFLSATFSYLLFIGPTQVLLPYIIRNTLHQSASAYGIVLAAGGVGALVGAVAMGRAREPRSPMTWIYVWWTIATLSVAGYGMFEKVWGLVLASLVINGAEAVGAVVWMTLKQRRVPIAMLGRVSSIDWLVSTALLPLSYALTPPVAHLLGARTTLVIAGVVGAVVTLGFLFLPGMRQNDPAEGGARATRDLPVLMPDRSETDVTGHSETWCLCCGWLRSQPRRMPQLSDLDDILGTGPTYNTVKTGNTGH